jgi:hypothetical protein
VTNAHQVIHLVIALKVAQPARQQVDVHVRHRLPSSRAVLHRESDSACSEVRLQLWRAAVRQQPQVC